MGKKEAIKIFGSVKEIADALGITTQAVYDWPDELTERLKNQIIGCAVMRGIWKKRGVREQR